jgi:hypothetical protein
MRFEVPQFIEMENKIFGPLSFKEFSYLAGGAGLSYIIYRFLPIWIAIVFIVPVISFALALAFYRPNDKPFLDMVQSAIIYFFGIKLYIWKKDKPLVVKGKEREREDDSDESFAVPHVGNSKLTDMSFNLSTQGKKDEDKGIKLKI